MTVVVMRPAEKNVAGRLQHALPGNDALAVILVATFAGVRLEDRGERLFELEEQGSPVAAEKEGDVAARADTANADDLASDVDDLVAIEENAAFVGQGGTIPTEHFGDVLADEVAFAGMVDERRMIDDAHAAVFYGGDVRDDVFASFLAGFGLDFAPAFLGRRGFGMANKFVGVDVGVPNLEGMHFGKAVKVLAVRAGHGEDGVFTLRVAESGLAKTENDAGGEALEVPFPRSGKSLIKIVDVEEQATFRTGEAAKIGGVAIATGLDANARGGSVREIPGHDGRGAAIKGKRRLLHAAVTNGEKLGKAAPIGVAKNADGVGAIGGGSPLRVGGTRDFCAKSFAGGATLLKSRERSLRNGLSTAARERLVFVGSHGFAFGEAAGRIYLEAMRENRSDGKRRVPAQKNRAGWKPTRPGNSL